MPPKTDENNASIQYLESLEKEPEPNQRQQDKLIAVVERHDPKLLAEKTVEITPAERASFLEKIESGKIDPDEIKAILVRVNAPYKRESAEELFAEMSDYPNLRQIQGMLAVAISDDLFIDNKYSPEASRGRAFIGAEDLYKMVQLYKEPATLQSKLTVMLNVIERYNTPAKRDEYERSLHVLMSVVYGKQTQYWDQYKLLAEEVNQTRK